MEKPGPSKTRKHLNDELSLRTIAGFRRDCENLIAHYVSLNTVSYDSFCTVWKKMNFSLIYTGRPSLAELLEVSDEVLNAAKKYVVNASNEYRFRVGALYLLYGLYFKQPTKGTQKIRMTLKDTEEYEKLLTSFREKYHFEPLYVATKLKVHKAFEYVITDYNYGIERNYKKYHENPTREYGLDPVFVTQDLKSIYHDNGLLKALEILNKMYYLEKSVLPEARNGKPEPSLDLVDKNISSVFEKKLDKLAVELENQCAVDSDSGPEYVNEDELETSVELKETNETENVGEIKRQLKSRGFKRKIKKFRESPTKKAKEAGTSK